MVNSSSQATPGSESFDFSLSEIKKQLEEMGMTDLSETALQDFQKDLQNLLKNQIREQRKKFLSGWLSVVFLRIRLLRVPNNSSFFNMFCIKFS